MMVKGFTKGLLLTQLPALVAGASTPVYKDASAPVEKRVKDLLGRMTIEDKMAQLMQGIHLILSWDFWIGGSPILL
jgi:beta-glucosidase